MAIAIFTSWTTYGTWLPGDARGWYQHGLGLQSPDPELQTMMRMQLKEEPIPFDLDQRKLVENTIRENCSFRGWILHAVNCRTNHVHVAVTAPNIRKITIPRETFKSWCTRRLRTQFPNRNTWWTDSGWDKWIDTEDYLQNVVKYILEGQ